MNHLRITQNELAALCDVSQGTVDRALNDRGEISKATKERILATAKKYGFRPSKGNSKSERTKNIGLILFDLNNEFFAELITEIELSAAKEGYLITVMFTHYSEERENECIRRLYSSGVDAIIISSVQNSNEFITFLGQLDIPVIALGNKIEGVPFVGADDFKAMFDLTKYVSERYCNIVYYSPALVYENAFAQKLRYDGFKEAVKGKDYTLVTKAEELKEGYKKGTAVICSTDLYAMYTLTHVKCDAVFGFDNIRILERLKLPVSSVYVDTKAVAEKTIELIKTGEKKEIIIPHKFAIRK